MSIIRIKESTTADVMNDDLVYKVGDDRKRTTAREWYRGEVTNFIPSKLNLTEEGAVEKYVLHGWLPEAPLINSETYVTAFGSCFAQYIRKHLIDKAKLTHSIEDHQPFPIVNNGEAINTTFAILQQFLWAWDNASFDEKWFDDKMNLVIPTEDTRLQTKEAFDKTDVFILTLGLSEIWYDAVTGQVFWRGIPHDIYDPSRHMFRVSTVGENKGNLTKIVKLIKKHNPKAKIIFTLSPVPLNATFRPVSCITANSVSKAILRVSVDEVMRENQGLFYWPAYEIVTSFFADSYREDNRHPKDEVIQFILDTFSKHYVAV